MVRKNWRAALLLVLLVGPVLVYVALGALWLRERGWLLQASLIWIALGVVFGLLAQRWTAPNRRVLPPIDWDLPRTFTPQDRQAWDLVRQEAERGESQPIEALSDPDTYLDTGKRLARRLAAHYQPDAQDPVEHVAVVDLLTALELAAEDLNGLCHQVPGGDLITPSHFKRAAEVSAFLSKANELYTYVLPVLQPVSGLVRLGTQKMMVQPAWKNMQHNLMRWFWGAYVNRLGTHLIELYSGRLSIGADHYRRLVRHGGGAEAIGAEPLESLTVAVTGAQGGGSETLRQAIEDARAGDLAPVRGRLVAAGLQGVLANRLESIAWVEVPEYPAVAGSRESKRDRSNRRRAVEAAAQADLVIVAIDGGRDDAQPDVAFARSWHDWFAARPFEEPPPVLVVMTGADRPDWGGPWMPPYDWSHPRRPREQVVKARLDALKTALDGLFPAPIAVGLAAEPPFGVAELVLPALASQLQRAERPALIRRLNQVGRRSKARRLLDQLGEQGRRLWHGWQ
jgi:hypothetical protein